MRVRSALPVLVLVSLLGPFSTPALGQATPADELAFVRQHLGDIVQVVPERISDPAVTAVFATPIYRVTVEIHEGDGTVSNGVIVGRVGDKLLALSRPSSDQDCPDLVSMLNPQFRLTGATSAETLQKALDAVYPLITDESKAARAYTRSGSQWTFVRGRFFDDQLGFIFTTDPAGKVASVKFALKLAAKPGA